MLSPTRNTTLAGGKYELIEEIGRGGMGSVWRAHALLLDRPCAIKFLTPEADKQPLNRERFVNEARAAARLRSPHAVTIFDVDFSDGMPFIAMELLSGESLEDRLRRGPLPPRLTCELIHQVALGLSHAHEANLVHRDLKPDNIFVVRENPMLVKLVDFGIAKDVAPSAGFRTVTGAIIGTPHYMSPEQALGRSLDLRSDLWSLGVVTYRCLTGRLPFTGETWPAILVTIVHGELPPLTSTQVALPHLVDHWWRRVMKRDPAERPASAPEMAASLQQAMLGTRVQIESASAVSAIRARPDGLARIAVAQRRWLPWAIGLLVAVLAGAASAWGYVRDRPSHSAATAGQPSSSAAQAAPTVQAAAAPAASTAAPLPHDAPAAPDPPRIVQGAATPEPEAAAQAPPIMRSTAPPAATAERARVQRGDVTPSRARHTRAKAWQTRARPAAPSAPHATEPEAPDNAPRTPNQGSSSAPAEFDPNWGF